MSSASAWDTNIILAVNLMYNIYQLNERGDSVIDIINIKTVTELELNSYKYIAYCGNNNNYWKAIYPIINLMADYSILGKPRNLIVRGNRPQTLENYRLYLDERLAGTYYLDNKPFVPNRQEEFIKALQQLRDNNVDALACWCAPLGCHCEIIREHLQ